MFQGAEIDAPFFSQNLLQLLPGIFDSPTEKVLRLIVRLRKNFLKKLIGFCVAVDYSPEGIEGVVMDMSYKAVFKEIFSQDVK